MVLAKMLQALELAEGEKVLDVGCATGYGAAVMARLVGEVIALEQDEELLAKAKAAFASTGIANVRAVQGRLVDGYKAYSPYDAILVEGCIEIEPAIVVCAIGRWRATDVHPGSGTRRKGHDLPARR